MRQKTSEKKGVVAEKTAVQSTGSPLHGPSSSGLRLCDGGRPLKLEEDMEKTPVIDSCTPTSSDSDCVVLKSVGNPYCSVDGPEKAS
uniref:Uncharacterized protein n=1 Tax=Arundo donax TaxID=35708 RepID=A0A0A9HQF9_ARUDO